ncbi:MAG: winged helix-turn-helix domain-containing protein, partial [Acidobacteriota bacterium]
EVWEGKAVVDETLSRCVSLLRQALGDDAQAPRYIETIPRRGYRLMAEVTYPAAGAAETPERTEAAAEAVAEQTEEPAPTGPSRWRRFGSAAVVAAILAMLAVPWIGGLRTADAPTREAPSRLAVLPFDNLSGDPGDQFVAAGLTEELIHQLARLSGLRVVSKTSVTREGVAEGEAGEIARRLNSDYLVEGSVLVVGERLRITAQLISPEQDSPLWSEVYDSSIADVLDLHREVALSIAGQVEARLTQPEREYLGRSRSVDGRAYRLYLEGRSQLSLRTADSVQGALGALLKAVELDEDFAEAWAALADAHLLSDPYLEAVQAHAYAQAQAAIDRALDLDPGSSSAYASLGQLRLLRDWDWEGAESAYRRAIELEPSHAQAHQWFSEMLSLAGRHEEALEEIRIAVELDPLSPLVHAAWGQRLNAAGRYREALEQLEQADVLGATFKWHLREVALAYRRLGMADAALAARIEHVRRRGASEEELASLTAATEAEGILGFWRWLAPRLLAPKAAEPMLIAEALAGQGDYEGALPWLQTAVRKRGSWFPHMQKSPAFDGLRQDPRFQRLLDEALPPG